MGLSDSIASKAYNNQKTFFFILSASIILFIIEISVSNVSDIVNVANIPGLTLFLGVFAVFVFVEYIIIKYTQLSTARLKKFPRFPHVLHKVTTLFQIILTALIISIIIQISLIQSYHTFFLLLAVSFSWGLSGTIFAILAWRFLKWYSFTHDFVVLLYAISCIVGVIGVITTTSFFDILIAGDPPEREETAEVVFQSFEPGTLEDKLQSIYSQVNIVYYLVVWFATALLIVKQNRQIDTIKQIIILLVSLGSYLSIFIVVDKVIEMYGSNAETIYVILLGYILPNIVSGILFGVPFFNAARSLDPNSPTRHNLILTGFGFVFLFVVTSSVIDHAPYPPLGVMSVCLVGLTTYLVFIGLYYSAISISENMTIRNFIKRSLKKEVNLLDKISYGEISDTVRDKVLKIARNKALEFSEIENTDYQISEEEIIDYTNEVIKEITKAKRLSSGDS